MTEFHQWYQERQVERTIQALKKNHFAARFFSKASEALAELWKMIPDGSTVGVGGSLTLHQIGFFDEAQKRPVKLLNPFVKGPSTEERGRIRREIFHADFFVCSSNAVTEDGKLLNIDSMGGRVAPMMFGPKKVILICGVNKIVKNLDEAWKKVQERTSPMNVKRLGYNLPCEKTGQCVDCPSPERICNAYVILAKRPRLTEFEIFLVGGCLGL